MSLASPPKRCGAEALRILQKHWRPQLFHNAPLRSKPARRRRISLPKFSQVRNIHKTPKFLQRPSCLNPTGSGKHELQSQSNTAFLQSVFRAAFARCRRSVRHECRFKIAVGDDLRVFGSSRRLGRNWSFRLRGGLVWMECVAGLASC